jgi:cell division protein FtsQ
LAPPVLICDDEHATALGDARTLRVSPRRLRKWLTALVAALTGAGAFFVMTAGGREARSLAPVWPDADQIARFAGFGIDQVSLTGVKFTLASDVFDALDLANVRSMASFDAAAVRSRLERLPWIATAELTRVFPDGLDVRITERKPFALWARGGRQYLIDRTGRVLSAVTGTTDLALPRVSGEGAAGEAVALLGLLAHYPDMARRLEEAERVAERRWTLKLSGGVTLQLPADGEAAVLEAIAAGELSRLIARGNLIIDLRAPGRAAVRATTNSSPDGGADRART